MTQEQLKTINDNLKETEIRFGGRSISGIRYYLTGIQFVMQTLGYEWDDEKKLFFKVESEE